MEELRKVFYHTMAELMHENQQVIYLDADLAGAMGTAGLFQEFPQQAFDMNYGSQYDWGRCWDVHKRENSLCTQFWPICFPEMCRPDFLIRLLQ